MDFHNIIFQLFLLCKAIHLSHSVYYKKNDHNLTEIPDDIPSTAVAVILENNFISQIKQSDFQGLTSVRQIRLSRNKLSQISPLGQSCTNLLEIHFTSNYLTSIPAHMFQGCTKIEVVAFSSNNITSTDWLKQLGPSLEEIFLNNNKISVLPADHFANLTGLQQLQITKNELTNIDITLLRYLPNLNKLWLRENFLSYIDDPYPWCRGVSCTTLRIFAESNPLKCDSSFCWLKFKTGITLARTWCFSKPWNSVTVEELSCNGMYTIFAYNAK